jgi:hypothetical protein
MNTFEKSSRRLFIAAGLMVVFMAIFIAAILLLPTHNVVEAGQSARALPNVLSTDAGPMVVPPLNPPIKTPEPGAAAAAAVAQSVDLGVEALQFRPSERLVRGQTLGPSLDAEKPAGGGNGDLAKPAGGVGSGPQEGYSAPDYAQLLAPMDWVPLLYEGFVGFSPPAVEQPFAPTFGDSFWTVYDFGPDNLERTWGANDFIYYYHDDDPSDVQSAWPAAFGADALDPNQFYYPENLSSWLDYGPMDLSNMADVIVSFGLWYKTEPGNDKVYFCASTDGSNYSCESWSGDSGGWTDQAYWLTSYAGYSHVWVAWIFESNSTPTPDDGPFVDEIWVIGDEIGGTSPTPTPDPGGELIENGSFETGDLTGWQGGEPSPTPTNTPTNTPTATPTDTPVPADPIQNGDFENGPDGSWIEYSALGIYPRIRETSALPVTPHSGNWAVWLGGADNELSAVIQNVSIPSGASTLSFWHWIASEDACGYDFGAVVIDNATAVDFFDLCADTNTGGWVRRTVDLGSYAGQTVQLDIRAETDGSLNSNFFLDDVALGSSLLASDLATTEPEVIGSWTDNPAHRKIESLLYRNPHAPAIELSPLLGTQRDQSQPDPVDLPRSAVSGQLRGSVRDLVQGASPPTDLTGAETPLGVLQVGVSDQTSVHGTYAAYLVLAGGPAVDTLYQTIDVPADINDLTLNFWFGVATNETVVGNDWFCAGMTEPGDPGAVLVDLGCVDATDTAPYWQEALYSLDAAELEAVVGRSVDLVFYLFSDINFFGYGAGSGATTAWVDYVRVYATGAGAGGAIDPHEPNDDAANATSITCSETVTGVIGDALGGYDVDWFELSNVPPGRMDIDIDAKSKVPPSALDSVVGLWDSNVDLVTWNDDDGTSFDSYVVYTNSVANATYYISVESYTGSGSPDAFYDLTVECAGGGDEEPPPTSEEPPVEEDTWTVMLYLNAEDPDFAPILTQYRTDIEAFIEDRPGVSVTILYDGPNTNDTVRYLVQPDGNYTQGTNMWPRGELNMGHPDTLRDFVIWAMDQYPAEQYYLAIDDHGHGVYGISWDPGSGNDQLTPPELYSALKNATRNGERKIDIFDYEACLMGLAENAYDLREWVDYVVFFEQISWGINTYPEYFKDLEGSDSSLEVGTRIIDRYHLEALYANGGRGLPHTISLVETAEMATVRQAVSDFGNALMATDTQARKDAVRSARNNSQAFAADLDATNPIRAEYIDLWDLADNVGGLAASQAAALKAAVDTAVVYERHASGRVGGTNGYTWDHSGAHGLSIYYPPTKSSNAFSGYATLYQMSRDGTWDEFLAWVLPPGIGRGMGAFRSEIKLVDEDALTFKYIYLPMVLK